MEKISRLACSCGETVEITPGADEAKCFACGKVWKQEDWPHRQRFEPIDAEFSQTPKIFPKTLPVTQMFSQEEILEIKEASVPESGNCGIHEPRNLCGNAEFRETEGGGTSGCAASERKTRRRELPATQMFTKIELDEIRKASLSDHKKED